jgi:lipoyl(octanoyl) transferase
MKTAELWFDEPQVGSWNMAMDSAMLEYAKAESTIVLRIYQWSPPTLSLGYFQAFDDIQRVAFHGDFDIVRRSSGGGAILHDREFTYALAIPEMDSRKGASEELYRSIHRSLQQWLQDLVHQRINFWEEVNDQKKNSPEKQDSFLCFERRSPVDLVMACHKILGSAQRRTHGGLLQHGSLLLEASPVIPHLHGVLETSSPLQVTSSSSEPAQNLSRIPNADRQASLTLSRFRDVDFAKAIQEGVTKLWKLDWSVSSPPSSVPEIAAEEQAKRFAASAWTRAR